MFPVVHVVQIAMAMRKKRRERAESEERKRVLFRIPLPFGADQRPGRDEGAGNEIPRIHTDSWRGTETERITNSGRPYPGT